MSNRRRPKMTGPELRQLDADWERAAILERMARGLARTDDCHDLGACALDAACPFVSDCQAADQEARV